MRFPGMIPNDHGRGMRSLNPNLQRPGSATPSDLAPGLHDPMLSGGGHPMQQFRSVKINPLQQGMIPTNMAGHMGQDAPPLHRHGSGKPLQLVDPDMRINFSGTTHYWKWHLLMDLRVQGKADAESVLLADPSISCASACPQIHRKELLACINVAMT